MDDLSVTSAARILAEADLPWPPNTDEVQAYENALSFVEGRCVMERESSHMLHTLAASQLIEDRGGKPAAAIEILSFAAFAMDDDGAAADGGWWCGDVYRLVVEGWLASQ